MSYDADYESVYMVEFASGRTIHVRVFDVEDVKEYCAGKYGAGKYAGEVIKTIYKEVYYNDEEEA